MGIPLISTQDRCTVCIERMIGSEIILEALDCLEIVLISVQDRCMVCAECTTGMEIALGCGTPR
jgi:hypothetical protein